MRGNFSFKIKPSTKYKIISDLLGMLSICLLIAGPLLGLIHSEYMLEIFVGSFFWVPCLFISVETHSKYLWNEKLEEAENNPEWVLAWKKFKRA